MSSLEKRQASSKGGTHGSRKCSDGISDTSSIGSLMDDTDREVSSLTDRAFRSLCIGEDAIYNDLAVSSPSDQLKARAQKVLQMTDLRTTCQESSSHGIQYEEKKAEVASTFQHSGVDVAQEHILRDERLSYISNGCMDAAWQQKSPSRVSSLFKAFGSGDSYCDGGATDTVKDKYQDFNNESWDKSALLSIQRELTEFSSSYRPNLKPGPLQSYGKPFHAVAGMNTTTYSISKFKPLNTNNLFFHSEFSPFQLWKDYIRFPFEPDNHQGFFPAAGFPRWYESPLYKELTATHGVSSSPAESRQFSQRKIENIAASQCSRSTIIQKALAIEKRCESEIASNCPPWKNNNFVKNKLPSNRPSTVSPSNEKVHRPDSSLLYHSRHTYEVQHKVGKVSSSDMSSRTTPFNITQLLTPVIPGRQETETSEILRFAHTPLVSECDSDLKAQSDAMQSRESYKSKASSLLFNLKDNRKRVKSTYSPTKFKSLEISDRNKQPSKLEGRESRLSETSGSKMPNQEHATVPSAWQLCNPVQPNYDVSLVQLSEHQQYDDKSHNNMRLVSPYAITNCNMHYLGSQNKYPDLLNNTESGNYGVLTNSGHGNSGRSPVGHINDSTRTFGTTRAEIENILSKGQLPAHLSADMSTTQHFCRREDAAHQNLKVGTNFMRSPSAGYINNQVTEENISWKRAEPVNMVTKETVNNNNGLKDSLPYKGEIAALIEMDKQRKGAAKLNLPSVNESYSMRKETGINKVNDNVNEHCLPKDKPIQDTKSFFQTYADQTTSHKQVQEDQTISHHLSDSQQNCLQKMANDTKGSEITTHEKAEVCLHGKMKHAACDTETTMASQRTHFLQSVEHKSQNNEGSVAYQPYKYESNKQWHIATTENKLTKGEESVSRRLQQSEIKAEQRDESNYIHSVSRTTCMQQQRTAYSSERNWITENRDKTEEHKPTSQIHHKQGYMNTDHNIPNIQRTLQNNNRSQSRGDIFNINDILTVRDDKHAKRVRENKYSFNARVADPTKVENQTSQVTSEVAEDIAAKSEPDKVQSRAQYDGNSYCKHENTKVSYGHVRKESHVPNDMKERKGKDIFITNVNDKVTLRALSCKEKGQTKQEILTSKLKAHAQKEISAIKEKGLAKHVIPSRTPMKQSTTASNENGQLKQDVLQPQKEITAEKLNHLFQGITYSSVPLYKEHRYQGKTEPKYESLTEEKEEGLAREIKSETDNVANEKERMKIREIIFQEEITELDKKHCEVSKPSNNDEKEKSILVANEKIPATCFLSTEESVKKEEEPLSNLSTTLTLNDKQYSTSNHDEIVKAQTNHIKLHNVLGNAITLESSVNKAKEQLSDDTAPEPTADTNTASLKCHDVTDRTKSINDNRKESRLTRPNAGELQICARHNKTPSDWLKDDVSAVEETVEFKEAANKQSANTEPEREHLPSRAGENKTILSESPAKTSNHAYSKPNTEAQENETWLEKQDAQRTKTNEDMFQEQHHNTDDDTLKISQNAHASKELGCQLISGLNKAISMNLDSSEEKKYSLEQETIINKLHCENRDAQETGQLKIRHENQNKQMIRNKEITENVNQQLQDSERTLNTEHNSQKSTEFQEHIESSPTEKNLSIDGIRTSNSNGSTSSYNEHEKSKDFLPHISISSKDHHLSSHPAADKSVDVTNPVPESNIIHIASKEDSSPKNDPVIYSICVSSASEAVSEDEPMIFTISVSSLSDASMIPGPENQEKSPKQLSIEQVKKDDKETSGNNNIESGFRESEENSKVVNLTLNNNTAEQEPVERKYESPVSKDKLRSTEVDNISSSYESLLAKCRLPNVDTIHLASDHKEQDKDFYISDRNKESMCSASPKIQNNTMDNNHVPVEKLTSDNFTKNHSLEFIKSNSSEESPEFLRNTEETNKQHVTHLEQAHQLAYDVVRLDRNTKHDMSSNQELLMSKVAPVCKDAVDTQSERQIMANGNVQPKENEEVGQKVQKMETIQKANDDDNDDDDDDDDEKRKNTEMVVKCKTDLQMTSEFSSANVNRSSYESPEPNSKISTNDCQIRIKTQNIGESLIQSTQDASNQRGNTKILLTYGTPKEECEEEFHIQEKVNKEHLQTGDNKALQNNKKELICISEFPEYKQAKFLKSNKADADKVKEMSNYTNSSGNQNPIIYATSVGKSVLSGPDISQEDNRVQKNDTEIRIKADAVNTKEASPPKNVPENARNTTSATVNDTGTKASCAPGMTDNDLGTPKYGKWKEEPPQKERELVRHEVKPLNKDLNTVSSAFKGGFKDAKCESSIEGKNRKEAKTQPQVEKYDHFEQLRYDHTGKNTGEKESKDATDVIKESSDSIKRDIESREKVRRDKSDQLSRVQYPQKDVVSERKGNTCDGKNTLESNPRSKYHDTALTKRDGIFTHAELTQQDKKTTRPEISALADYARLRVIAAEDDTNTEKDLLQKMNTSQKYHLSAAEPQKVNLSMCVRDTEKSEQLSINKKFDNLNATVTPLQVQERVRQCAPSGRINEYPKVASLAKISDDEVFAIKDTESTKEKILTNHMQARASLTAKDDSFSKSQESHQSQNSRANSFSVQTQIGRKTDPKPKQPVNANLPERKVYSQVKNSQSVAQVSNQLELNNVKRPADNQIMEEVKADETSEELQYYIVNSMESESKPKNNYEPPSLSHNAFLKKDLTQIHATTPRSNTSSPATGKPIMFRVKDNTGKMSSVTKTVRPRFHRSFSEEISIGSPIDNCFGLEKDKVEYDHVNDLKEPGTVPVLHEQSITSPIPSIKEIQARNMLLSPRFMAPEEPRSYSRRSNLIERNQSQSLIRTATEDVDSLAASSVVMTNSRDFDTEHIRHTYARPESSCYERPESACSDMRPSSKPPAVPPKTEKALRRAKRLTSRKISKVGDKMASDISVHPEHKSIRTVSSLPASPMVQMSTTQSVQASPPISQYQVEPISAAPAHSIVTHSFPMNQRKLFLQDPNSGQLFMVDVPVQVKTKTFFDPETGKYLQLNVRQRAPSTVSQAASLGMLGHQYVVYPGFLPMSVSVSSVPSVRSSSQMSAPATLTGDVNQMKARHEPTEQEILKPEHHRNVHEQNRPVYRTREQTVGDILHAENARMTPRQTHIIKMSELEDFAMENT